MKRCKITGRVLPTHGCRKTPEYRAWQAMFTRCTNRKHDSYHRYGGRGITVCKRWVSFTRFLSDMGWRPTSKHSVDRVNNNKGYSPSNCRWSTIAEQSRNRENNKYLTFSGTRMTVTDWAQRLGMPQSTLWYRLVRLKWSVKKALATPTQKHGPVGSGKNYKYYIARRGK